MPRRDTLKYRSANARYVPVVGRRTPRERVLAKFLNRSVSKRIVKAREEKGWTQEELAHKAGLSRTVVSKLEIFSKDPLVSTLAAVARALGVSMDYLVWGK